ncbi:phage GP46 family protein [Pseudomonas sp.]|uniref:phage GP46 family protein n=1 Tax=Pseudomonas sp. TaxID=306 RepID=UPI003D0AFE6C
MDVQIAFDNLSKRFDMALAGADLSTDTGLATAVIISLFTDRRADAGDQIPDGTADRRGWWGDTYADEPGDRIGSKLWLLGREKQLAVTARRAEAFAREALQWLIEDGVARRVGVVAEWSAPGVLGLAIEIERPDGTPLTFRFSNLWEAMHAL